MRKRQAGYALLVVLLLASLILISLATAVPRILTQGQREREEELIFRGKQYQRAIGLYYKKFARFPLKLDDLLETNDRAYLRRLFRDPMTPDGEWRVIRVGPGGELIGSQQGRSPLQLNQGQTSDNGDQKPDTASGGTERRTGSSGDVSTYPIAGVASRSSKRSVKVYQGFARYDLWEFIYDPVQEALQNQPATPTGPSSEGEAGAEGKPNGRK
ncbi:MAG: hypothetical protein ACE5IP_01270 [Terriglobia bacterium]